MKRTETASIPVHERLPVGILLALTGGFLDAYTYLCWGGVFANAQTGNIVLLAVDAAQRQIGKAVYYLVPVTAFFLGVLAAEWIRKPSSAKRVMQWEHIILLVEILLMLVIGFLPVQMPNAVVNVTISFICSMQVHSFRRMKGAPYATTVCTGNLRSAAENFFLFCTEKDVEAWRRFLRYMLIIACFCVGAFLGAVLSGIWQTKAVWGCCALLCAALGIMLRGK